MVATFLNAFRWVQEALAESAVTVCLQVKGCMRRLKRRVPVVTKHVKKIRGVLILELKPDGAVVTGEVVCGGAVPSLHRQIWTRTSGVPTSRISTSPQPNSRHSLRNRMVRSSQLNNEFRSRR
jgi:hypothetical protein